MKILFVKPSYLMPNGKIHKAKALIRPELTLPLLAALTPPDIEVKINDETVEEIDFDTDADLIAITSMTRNIDVAYRIADEFRTKNKTVVMGGIHVSFLPEEAIRHCDAVVIGEAEGQWGGLITDYRKGRLKKLYRSARLNDLKGIPSPRFDLIDTKKFKIKMLPIQATRGCPHNCEFCTVTRFFKGKVRARPIEDVLNDVRAAKKSGAKWIFFVDENIVADRDYAKKLFESLKPLHIEWMGQSPIQIAGNPELLKLAVESGCVFLEIGFESIKIENLKHSGKRIGHIDEYTKGIGLLSKNKIIIGASFILGFDNDGVEVFDDTIGFLRDHKLPIFDPYILTPSPGTRLLERLNRERRITHRDWRMYGGKDIVFKPKLMTPDELNFRFWKMVKAFYSLPNIFRRLFHTSFRNMKIVFYVNMKSWLNLRFEKR
jgi:radical SAM superfamily enzyme YgiQ (UPF0313 family)